MQRAALAKTHAPIPVAKADRTGETFKDQVERYIASKDETSKHTAATKKWAKRALFQFAAYILNKSAKSVKAEDISGFYAALRKRKKPNGKFFSENAARSYLRAVRGFMSWTVSSKLRFDNPAKEVRLGRPTQASRTRFATREQRAAIMAAADNDSTRFILYCTFWAGMRFDEIVEAKPDWFNLEANYIYVHEHWTRYEDGRENHFVPKNKKNRYIPLSPDFKAFLTGYKLRGPYMLEPTVEHGKAEYRYDFRAPWFKVRAAAAANINATLEKQGKEPTANFDWLTPHVARHTFASLLAQKGVSIYKIAEWIGDTIEVTTQHYAHLAPTDSAIAAID